MEQNNKIFISNVITFIFLLVSFLFLYNHLQSINFEYSYKNHQIETDIYNYIDGNNEKLYIKPILIILTGLNLILILNTLWYINNYPNFKYFMDKLINRFKGL